MGYFLKINGHVIGPMDACQLMAYDVNPDIAVSRDSVDWAPLYTYPELMQLYQQSNVAKEQWSEVNSKKILCGIMAIIFGTLGIQYFIVGKVAGGIITILLSIVTCGAWEIITLIQGILMLCMPDSEFKRKYMDSTSTLPLF